MDVKTGFSAALSRVLHKLLNAFGVEVRLLRNIKAAHAEQRRNREFEAWRLLQAHPFTFVLDVGANEGQFAAIARRLWPLAQVHSFEPLPDVFAAMKKRFGHDPMVTMHNIGLSDEAGSRQMHRSAFSPSSSLLPMAELHRREWPQSADHTDTDVRLERLDDWMHHATTGSVSPMLVKIDVQGFEMAVIDGGAKTLREADYVVLEVSFHELYEGQPLFESIHDRMRELGFIYRGNVEQFSSKDHRLVLYADAVFENLRKVATNV